MTFASLLTPEGMIPAAAFVTLLIQVVKGAFPLLDARVSGALMAFIASAILYALAAFVLPHAEPDALLGVFAAWLTVAGLAMGIKAGTDHVQAVTGGTS